MFFLIVPLITLLIICLLYSLWVPYRVGVFRSGEPYPHTSNLNSRIPTLYSDFTTPILSSDYLEQMYNILTTTCSLFRSFEIQHVLIGPALLGQYMLGTYIPWCTQIDMVCSNDSKHIFLNESFETHAARENIYIYEKRFMDNGCIFISQHTFGPMIQIHFSTIKKPSNKTS